VIKAKHKNWARWIFIPYMNRILKKNFSHFYLVNEIPEIPDGSSLVVTPNHISWWDGFFADFIFSRLIKRKLFILMLESQLKKFSFFKYLGAFSIKTESSRSVAETATYTKNILSKSDRFVIFYPQGEIEAYEKRPLNMKKGLKYFIKGIENEVFVLPVGFKIHYYNEKYPAIILRFGQLINSKKISDDLVDFEKDFVDNLDKLSEAAYKKEFVKDYFQK
jgi:1-acyl-sn-glycerol-3-phosphate acyltransferase